MDKEELRDELFSEWAQVVVQVAVRNQDKTFRQLLEENLIESWASYYLRKSQPKKGYSR